VGLRGKPQVRLAPRTRHAVFVPSGPVLAQDLFGCAAETEVRQSPDSEAPRLHEPPPGHLQRVKGETPLDTHGTDQPG
jgi:hypothetical protein